MKFLVFALCIVQLFSEVWVAQQPKGTPKKPKVQIGDNHRHNNSLKFPNRFLRIYDNWAVSSNFNDGLLKSIPLSVNQKNKFRLDLSARLPEINESKIERVEILMEFYNVPKVKRQGMNGTFHAQVTPKDSRISGKSQEESDKSVGNSLVEMSFDVTDLLRSHLELGKKRFKVRMSLKRDGENKTEASLGGDAAAFLLFHENIDHTSSVVVEATTTARWSNPPPKAPRSTSGKVPKLPKEHEHGNEYVGGGSKFYPAWDFSPRIKNFGITCGFQFWQVSTRNLPWAFEAVHPPVIEVNRCHGGCYRKRKFPSNRQDLGPYMRALQIARTPCCVPLVLKPQLLIVRLNGFYAFQMVDGLRVRKCGCM